MSLAIGKSGFEKTITFIGYLSVLAILGIIGYSYYVKFVYDPMDSLYEMIGRTDINKIYQEDEFLLTNDEAMILEYFEKVEMTEFTESGKRRYVVSSEKNDIMVIHLEGEGMFLYIDFKGRVRFKLPPESLRVRDNGGYVHHIRIPKDRPLKIEGLDGIKTFDDIIKTANFSYKMSDKFVLKIYSYIYDKIRGVE